MVAFYLIRVQAKNLNYLSQISTILNFVHRTLLHHKFYADLNVIWRSYFRQLNKLFSALKFNPEIVARAKSVKNDLRYVKFLTSFMFSLSRIPALYWSQKPRQLMLPLNFGISSFGNLTILTWKDLCFTEFSTKVHWNTRLAASDVCHMFTQSIKFFWFDYRTDVWKRWFIK